MLLWATAGGRPGCSGARPRAATRRVTNAPGVPEPAARCSRRGRGRQVHRRSRCPGPAERPRPDARPSRKRLPTAGSPIGPREASPPHLGPHPGPRPRLTPPPCPVAEFLTTSPHPTPPPHPAPRRKSQGNRPSRPRSPGQIPSLLVRAAAARVGPRPPGGRFRIARSPLRPAPLISTVHATPHPNAPSADTTTAARKWPRLLLPRASTAVRESVVADHAGRPVATVLHRTGRPREAASGAPPPGAARSADGLQAP
ncbi:hypothetical protein SXANM310S_02135 [Streptomyces xanthochromogenes]